MFKKIVIIIILLLIGGVLTLAITSGMFKIPFLSSLLGTDSPRNLIGEVDPNLYKDVFIKEKVTLTSEADKYCLICDISYEDFGPMDVTISSDELSSLLQSWTAERDTGEIK